MIKELVEYLQCVDWVLVLKLTVAFYIGRMYQKAKDKSMARVLGERRY